MDYRAALNQERERLSSLADEGITVKRINGKYYKYRQIRANGKVKSEYIGIAVPSEMGIKKRLRLVEWLLKNEDRFIEGLRLLQEVRNFPD